MLIGSYFVSEYSLESAALFNPSIVPHPDQSGVPADGLRFILSLRATGEGHISSITFRTGTIYTDGRIEVTAAAGYLSEPRQIPNRLVEKALFERKLFELELTSEFTRSTMSRLGDSFNQKELCRQVKEELTHHGEQRGGEGALSFSRGYLDAGGVKLRSSVQARTGAVRACHLSDFRLAKQWHRGRPVRALPER